MKLAVQRANITFTGFYVKRNKTQFDTSEKACFVHFSTMLLLHRCFSCTIKCLLSQVNQEFVYCNYCQRYGPKACKLHYMHCLVNFKCYILGKYVNYAKRNVVEYHITKYKNTQI